jgi:DNA-binding NarL/FixJ family response regulator
MLAPDVLIHFRAYIEYMANIRVLIVDDVERVRQDLCTFLRLAGEIEIVSEARDGLEAIRLVETLCPQVVLMDLEMPILDGYEATRQIKAIKPSCRVIALTIHAGQTEQQRALQAGADDFIVKGAPLETLMKAIRNAPDLDQI